MGVFITDVMKLDVFFNTPSFDLIFSVSITLSYLSSLAYDSYDSHSGLEEPRGTRTVRNEPGARDITTCN